jgi:predicted TPR repeat methyltransferase
MMAHARQRGIYDSLVIAELTAYLQTAADTFDVIVCADTFIYFGSLAAVIQGAARSLRPGGVFIFTVEHLQFDPSGAGWRLQPHGRYSQSEPYIRQCLEESGLRVINLAYGIIRLELKDPVAGMTVTAARPG